MGSDSKEAHGCTRGTSSGSKVIELCLGTYLHLAHLNCRHQFDYHLDDGEFSDRPKPPFSTIYLNRCSNRSNPDPRRNSDTISVIQSTMMASDTVRAIIVVVILLEGTHVVVIGVVFLGTAENNDIVERGSEAVTIVVINGVVIAVAPVQHYFKVFSKYKVMQFKECCKGRDHRRTLGFETEANTEDPSDTNRRKVALGFSPTGLSR
ncbi:hypothetical protein SESBI_10194 [Sesbania bispinosa]|nr:hypothetical protein SESBI_10194 [Sesbania bispinosa]